ncbi:MAG: anti-sigma factor [Sterolibacteriaceae bacterium]|jgi:anti-sigma factor RsiW|uniref:Anti-sigma factor n=1 Tax=Candidatus Methylophosphatis roskildensis TaxID=2899263 RepID=A0A9D7HS95_9PROT|nr:anti-sigma factor [Candidatus Methylophosphatis roskildensis]
MNSRPVSEEQLHAYADGRLGAAESMTVASWLAERPEVHEQVRAWREQTALLHGRFDAVMLEQVPPRLINAGRHAPLSRTLRVAAVLAWLSIGGIVGFLVRGTIGGSGSTELVTLPHEAAIAHAVYAPEVRHPVEVTADQEQHLVTWLSKRLGTPVKAPSLRGEGYELVGGRLLPGNAGPVAQFMYQDARGQRLTLYLRTDAAGNRETAFRFAQEGKVGVFYWLDGKLGYALSGEQSKADLMRVVDSVYRQLNP